MTRRFRRLTVLSIAAALGWAASDSASAAVTLLVDSNGELVGATGVDVGGILYDVQFVDGTCISIFSGCDAQSDFPFASAFEASFAVNALLSQVFIDSSAGNFDSSPSGTLGCEDPNRCVAIVPYDVVAGSWIAAGVNNSTLDASDFIFLNGTNPTSVDFAQNELAVFARFTLSSAAVPEPTTWAMMLLGFGAIGYSFRRARRDGFPLRQVA